MAPLSFLTDLADQRHQSQCETGISRHVACCDSRVPFISVAAVSLSPAKDDGRVLVDVVGCLVLKPDPLHFVDNLGKVGLGARCGRGGVGLGPP